MPYSYGHAPRSRHLDLDRAAGRDAGGRSLGRHLLDKPECIVPTVVQLELSEWWMSELRKDEADPMIACRQKCVAEGLRNVACSRCRHEEKRDGRAPDSQRA